VIDNGALFKQLRRDRHLTLTDIASAQVSIAAISKFERGLTDMTFQRFEYLLGRINVSLEEFLFLRAWRSGEIDPHLSSTYRFNSQIDHAFIQRLGELAGMTKTIQSQAVIDQLQVEINRYLEPPVTRRARFMAAGIQFYQSILQSNRESQGKGKTAAHLATEMDQLRGVVRPFISYVYSIENWGYFELLFFQLLHTAIPNETAHQLLPIAMKRTAQYQSFTPVQGMRYNLLFGIFSDFINARQMGWAKEALDLVENILQTEHDLNHANRLLFCRGWYALVAGDETGGIKTCEQAISIETILGQTNMARQYTFILTNIQYNKQNPGDSAYFM
jgi:transcriptional regulator with XRE-family HTH domain